MGVPKFFRWISERYPCLSASIENNEIPQYDCLYLDMNGIIHICSHPDDTNIQFRISESDIFSNIFNYIEFLFKTVKPTEVFFLAVDGVAPRAKMNQQRARRFKSAKEASNREVAAVQSGIQLPEEKRFDSNAITPGTEFMNRLQEALISFIDNKVKTDSLWQGLDIILSGHETPGEGEHKIQEFIRYRKSLPDYNPNTRHCLYGLDADLILLGLASHEPYFSLLREEVTFSKKKTKRAYIAEETKFFLLHLSLLREYIDYEFSSLKNALGDDYNLERIIDDWIVMSFLVGNDFVPHLPHLHIHSSALPLLWQTYIKCRPKLSGYINEGGKLNLINLLQYISELSVFDRDTFSESHEDMKWLNSKKIGDELHGSNVKKSNSNTEINLIDLFNDSANLNKGTNLEVSMKNTSPEINVEEINPKKVNRELSDFENIELDSLDKDFVNLEDFDENEADESPEEQSQKNLIIFSETSDLESADDLWDLQYSIYKKDYYYSKFGLIVNDDILTDQANKYITALQWISSYYFHGVPSWEWFYPQHYAPFMSDLSYLSQSIKTNGITFDIGRPFLPFEQLMAVLPADSCELLPLSLKTLMTEETSPIIDFYPKTFKTDLNGKKKDWEAVVLIPFIDEKRLLEALETKICSLEDSEKDRNTHGPHIKFRYSKSGETKTYIDPQEFKIPLTSILSGLCPKVRLDATLEGFPTFKYISHETVHEKVGVKLFEFSSNNASIALKINPPSTPILIEDIAKKFINKIVYVDWPIFSEVKVVAILDDKNRYTLQPKKKNLVIETLNETDLLRMKEFRSTTANRLYKKSAIIINEEDNIVLEVYHSNGRRYKILESHKAGSTLVLEPSWNLTETFWHLHQLAVLKDVITFLESNSTKRCTKLSQLFQKDDLVFCLDSKHYGLTGKVKGIKKTSIRVCLNSVPEPTLPEINDSNVDNDYMNTMEASELSNMSPLLFSRITGTLFINLSSENDINHNKLKKFDRNKPKCSIGLDLKDNKSDLQIPGWVTKRKHQGSAGKWCYSRKVINILDDYKEKFPEVFELIQKPNFENLSVEDMFEKSIASTKVNELKEFLSNLPYRHLDKISNESIIIGEADIKRIESTIDELKSFQPENPITVEIPFDELYRPHRSLDGIKADPSASFELLDRVICCSESYTVPIGTKGVVIGIEPKLKNDVLLEVLFDSEFNSAICIRGSKPRCYRMPKYTLINITYGQRKLQDLTTTKPNSNNLKTPSKRENRQSHVTPSSINANTTPDIHHNKHFNPAEFSSPITPSNDFSSDQKSFIARCNEMYVKEMSHEYDIVYTLDNCIPEYFEFFSNCINYYGILNPKIIERFHKNDFLIAFTSDYLSLPFAKENDISSARFNIMKRVFENFQIEMQNHFALLSPNQTNGHREFNNNRRSSNQKGRNSDQFLNNPFLQVYPPQHQNKTFVTSPPSKANYLSPRNKKLYDPEAPIHPEKQQKHNNAPMKDSIKVHTEKPFIAAPKPKNNLFRN